MAEDLDPQLARLAFDMGNMAFATAWVALGSFAIAYGWAVLSSGQQRVVSLASVEKLPRLMGWWAIAAGVCLVAARAAWTTYFWLVGYTLFWIWVVTLCVILLRWASRARSLPSSLAR